MVASAGPPVVRLLIVDDDDATRTLLTAVFSRRNEVVAQCVADGESALSQIRQNAYDAIILDLMLPGKNGFDIIRELKSRAPALLSRTIVLTAMAEATLRDFADARLLRRLIRKPFDLDELLSEVLSCGVQREVDPVV